MLTLDDRPAPVSTTGLSGRDLGDEYVVYDKAGDRFHVLNGSAREIYLLCDGRRSVEQIVESMAERYRLDLQTARRDTQETLERLLELGVLRAADGPADSLTP